MNNEQTKKLGSNSHQQFYSNKSYESFELKIEPFAQINLDKKESDINKIR